MKKSVLVRWMCDAFASGTVIVSALLAGCSGGHDHESDQGHGGHAHHAPHGGALAMLGNHVFQLELVPNPGAERLELYVLDGGAEHFVRIDDESFEAVVRSGDREWPILFRSMGNEATGETAGDSSFFVAESKEASKLLEFDVEFARLEFRGHVFESVTLPFPEGAH